MCVSLQVTGSPGFHCPPLMCRLEFSRILMTKSVQRQRGPGVCNVCNVPGTGPSTLHVNSSLLTSLPGGYLHFTDEGKVRRGAQLVPCHSQHVADGSHGHWALETIPQCWDQALHQAQPTAGGEIGPESRLRPGAEPGLLLPAGSSWVTAEEGLGGWWGQPTPLLHQCGPPGSAWLHYQSRQAPGVGRVRVWGD